MNERIDLAQSQTQSSGCSVFIHVFPHLKKEKETEEPIS